MAGSCSICTHDDREAIDEALIGGVSYRNIAKRHAVTPSALTRHRRGHLSPQIVAVQAARGESVADRVERLYDRASAILTAAESSGQGALTLAAIRELRSLCELLGRLSGELDNRPQLNVINLATSPDWVALRTAILTALRPYPDALAAIVAAIDPPATQLGGRVIDGD